MKLNSIIALALCALFFSCNDDLTDIGSSIQPDEDKILILPDTFTVSAKTIKLDSVYARNTSALLGEYTDGFYGTIKSDYMAQFYAPEKFNFGDKTIVNGIDSVILSLEYYNAVKIGQSVSYFPSFIGDSITPMRATAYEISKPLINDFYTNFNPAGYFNPNKPVGNGVYTGSDVATPDSLKIKNGYVPTVKIKLDKEIGNRFLTASQDKNSHVFDNLDNFLDFFKGIYVKNTYNTGTIINIKSTFMTFHYRYNDTIKGKATVVNATRQLATTTEVFQLNNIKNDNIDDLLKPDEKKTYIKSPSGVATQLDIPFKAICEALNKQSGTTYLNSAKFKVNTDKPETNVYGLTAPKMLMMIASDKMDFFFKNNMIPGDSIPVGIASFNKNAYNYDFGNIANVIQKQLDNNRDKVTGKYNPNGKFAPILLIPVNATINSQNQITAVGNDLTPSAIKLRKGVYTNPETGQEVKNMLLNIIFSVKNK